MAPFSRSSCRARADGDRVSQTYNPLRATFSPRAMTAPG